MKQRMNVPELILLAITELLVPTQIPHKEVITAVLVPLLTLEDLLMSHGLNPQMRLSLLEDA